MTTTKTQPPDAADLPADCDDAPMSFFDILYSAQRSRCGAAAPLAARVPIRDNEWAVGTSVLLDGTDEQCMT